MTMFVVRIVIRHKRRWALSMMRFMINIITRSPWHRLPFGVNYWSSSSLVSLSMVDSAFENGLLFLLHHPLGVWSMPSCLYLFTHIIIFLIVDSPHCIMRAPMLVFLVCVFGMNIYIFGSFKLTLVLWMNLIIIFDLDLDFTTSVSWLWLVYLPFFLFGNFSTDLKSLRLSYFSFSVTVTRTNICSCSVGTVFQFPEVNRTSYLLRAGVIRLYDVISSCHCSGSYLFEFIGRIIFPMPHDMPWTG